MQRLHCRAATCIAACLTLAPATAHARWTLTVLHTFHGPDGEQPLNGVTLDATGNVYGTTQGGGKFGGSGGYGTVFKLSPPGSGQTKWRVAVHSLDGRHGEFPDGGVVLDAAGNIYGTTLYGTEPSDPGGTVFRLEAAGNNQSHWRQTLLHRWRGDGSPGLPLTLDGEGNLFGATWSGDVFALAPPGSGHPHWQLRTLQSFGAQEPNGSLVRDAAGHLYGTVALSGDYEYGSVYELSPPGDGHGKWTLTALHYFSGTDGQRPAAGVIMDAVGNLYGTTFFGGSSAELDAGYGVVFELSPPAQGQTQWTETVLHAFTGKDGSYTYGSVVRDTAGNLYGTTNQGGKYTYGTAFELIPPRHQGGGWTRLVLHEFDYEHDGGQPWGTLAIDPAGNLYGTTSEGGDHGTGGGTVFRLSPNA